LRTMPLWIIIEAMPEAVEPDVIIGDGIRVEPTLEKNVPVFTFKLNPEPAPGAADLFEAVKAAYDKLSAQTKTNSVVIDLQPGTGLKAGRPMVRLLQYVTSKRGRLYYTGGREEQAALAMVGFTNLPRVLATRTKDDALGLAS